MPKDAERSPIILPPRNEITREGEQNYVAGSPRPKRRRFGLFVSLALLVLTAIVVAAGLFMRFGSTGPLARGTQTAVTQERTGPFVKSPYNDSQVNALTHLVDRMN